MRLARAGYRPEPRSTCLAHCALGASPTLRSRFSQVGFVTSRSGAGHVQESLPVFFVVSLLAERSALLRVESIVLPEGKYQMRLPNSTRFSGISS